MLCVARVLLLLRLNSQTVSGVTKYVFPQYRERTQVLDDVDDELGCVCLRWSTTNEQDHSAVINEELNNKMDLTVTVWFVEEPFTAISGVAHVGPGSCWIPLVRGRLTWPYPCFYINLFFSDDLLQLGIAQSEE